jgi:hypothetical protein
MGAGASIGFGPAFHTEASTEHAAVQELHTIARENNFKVHKDGSGYFIRDRDPLHTVHYMAVAPCREIGARHPHCYMAWFQ